jgi:hypothetical protein
MGSNYVGVDSFSANLTLQTDDDSPNAAIFRLPNERLLDNDVHLLGRSTAAEARATVLERGVHIERGRRFEVFDDFANVIDNKGATVPHILSDSGPWNVVASAVADVTIGNSAGSQLTLARAANAMSAGVYKNTAQETYSLWRFRALGVGVTTLASDIEIGLVTSTPTSVPGAASGGCVSAVFLPGTSANWMLRTRNATSGLQSLTDTGVAVVALTGYRIELGHNGTTFTLAINGAAAVTAGANIPGVSEQGLPVIRFAGSTASAGCLVGMIHAYSTQARW